MALSGETMTTPALPIALADLETDISNSRRELLTLLAHMHNVDPPRQAALQADISTIVADLARLDTLRRGCAVNLSDE